MRRGRGGGKLDSPPPPALCLYLLLILKYSFQNARIISRTCYLGYEVIKKSQISVLGGVEEEGCGGGWSKLSVSLPCIVYSVPQHSKPYASTIKINICFFLFSST